MKKTFLILAVMFALQGCVAAAIVVGAGAGVTGGLIVNDHRSTKTILDDKDIAVKAQEKINHDKELQGKVHASVAVFNHVVLLVGQAPTQELSEHAQNLVNSVPKIKTLRNEITIEAPISTSTQTHDAWLTTKIKSVLLAEKGLQSTQLKIVTENGVVYIMGLITRGQAELATEKTRSIEGVQKVVKLFEYISLANRIYVLQSCNPPYGFSQKRSNSNSFQTNLSGLSEIDPRNLTCSEARPQPASGVYGLIHEERGQGLQQSCKPNFDGYIS